DMLADAGKVKQMLLNLVSNAIKFTPEGGSVTIGAVRIKETIEISVTDTGIGISESDLKSIFREFHQVDFGPGRKHEGTGLGLALTKRFALLHGGDVRAASRPNKGSVFTLSLPEGDGWEIMTRLKSDATTSGIPIVVVSVVDNPELGLALGAIDYFVKPVDTGALIKRLNRFDFMRHSGKNEVRVLVVDDDA